MGSMFGPVRDTVSRFGDPQKETFAVGHPTLTLQQWMQNGGEFIRSAWACMSRASVQICTALCMACTMLSEPASNASGAAALDA